jgi:AcrR family transcriptional regulator
MANMEEAYVEKSVRTRLILAGIAELEEHGLSEFSLRRAALAAQVSCAAPYRHFKDKDEYIREIIKYVNSKWELLSHEIERIFANDPAKLAVEMCMASLRFRIANRNLRAVFTLAAEQQGDTTLDTAVIRAVEAYATSRGIDADTAALKSFTARALIAGSLTLAGEGEADTVLSLARQRLTAEFKD